MLLRIACGCVAFSCVCWSEVQSRPSDNSTSLTNEEEVKTLVKKLGDTSFSVREEAGKRLEDMGLQALPVLRKAQESRDLEIRHRIAKIIDSIERHNQLPRRMKVNDAEFETITDPVWRIPTDGTETDVNLGLKITNCDTELRYFYLDAIELKLRSADGKPMQLYCGRDHLLRGRTFTPVLNFGGSYTYSRFNLKLSRRKDDKGARLMGEDDFGNVRSHDAIQPGKYKVSLLYINEKNIMRDPLLWPGVLETYPVTVEIK
jgi:hypothetical protein